MKKIVDGIEIEMTSTLIQRMAKLRNKRNALLKETDWMGNSDVAMSDEWKTYRQELRDITKTEPVDMALSNITFPTK